MALIIEIKVVPGASAQRWILDKQGILKCYVVSPPERNKANQELVRTLARALSLARTSITIVSGETARLKRIRIEASITFDQLIAQLGIEKQQTIF